MMKSILIEAFIFLYSFFGPFVAKAQNPFNDLRSTGANWGIWIDNGLVNPGEVVRMIVSVPLNTPAVNLTTKLEIHPRYLEDSLPIEKIPLKWKKDLNNKQWRASVSYRPHRAGNYYAAVQFYGHEIFSYFAAWKPGLTAVNFWVHMPAEYHDPGDFKDIYLPEISLGHLPIDYELVLVGELVFKKNWKPRKLFRQAQVEAGAEVIPFFDGGYFHKLVPEFTRRFDTITSKVSGYANLISAETRAVHGLYKLPDPTFQSLSVDQCSALIEAARNYWMQWGFRPFTGVSTYSPSNELIESCRDKGIKWLSGVFADYDFTDGTDRWEVGWIQKHRGMPSFPYLISKTDYRWTGNADGQSTMMFPGWQNLPVWDHEDRHQHGTDISSYEGYPGMSPVGRMMLFSKVFERDNKLAGNRFPLAETFCIQMNNPKNGAVIKGLIDRARQGKLIFIHKRYLQKYFQEHDITKNPDVCYTIPDSAFAAGCPSPSPYSFSYETVWEGAEGKAAFISKPTAPLEKGRSIYMPVWWYDYRSASPLSPKVDLSSVDLSGVSIELGSNVKGKIIMVRTSKALNGMPICLWDLNANTNQSVFWMKKYRAMKVAAPKNWGVNVFMWIIRPALKAGSTIIPLY